MKIKRFGFYLGWLILGLVAVLFLVISCKHDEIPADQMAPVAFSEVQLIYSNYCGKCHNDKGGETRYNFNDPVDIVNSVVAGNASKSKSYQAMISTFQIMPPDIAMPISKRTLIRLWIEQGAKQK